MLFFQSLATCKPLESAMSPCAYVQIFTQRYNHLFAFFSLPFLSNQSPDFNQTIAKCRFDFSVQALT